MTLNQTFTGSIKFDELPFDIINKIFSEISQRECLNCMTVCRSWYENLPQYTQDTVWSKLRISSTNKPPENNKIWERCIGKHVRHVEFEMFDKEQELYFALSQIYQLGCTQIESLEFVVCVIPSQYVFLSILKPLQSTLKKLNFKRHGSDLNFLDTLKLYPYLTHFSFSQMTRRGPVATNVGREQAFSTMTDTDDENIEFPNLIHLFMDNDTIKMQERLAPIVKRCPNLQYLAYGHCEGSIFTYLPTPADAYIDPVKILSWCPRLVYLEAYSLRLGKYREIALNHLHRHRSQQQAITNHKNINNSIYASTTLTYEKQLRALFVFESDPYYKPDTVQHVILNSTNTLEFLGIGRCLGYNNPLNWSSTFQNLGTMSALHTLIIDNIIYDDPLDSINTMLTKCPMLQILELNNSGNRQQRPCLNLPRVLRCLKQLKCLDLNNIALDWVDDIDSNENTTADEKVESTTIVAESQEQVFFQQIAKLGSRINTIRLRNIYPPLTDNIATGFACLPALEELSLNSFNFYTREGLDRFFETLVYANSGVRKIQMKFLQGDCLSDTAITLIGKLPHLQTFSIYGAAPCYLEIESSAVTEMLRDNSSLSSIYIGQVVFSDVSDNSLELLEKQLAPTYSVLKLAFNYDFISLAIARESF